MTSWSAKRRFVYGGAFLLVMALIVTGLSWKFLYEAPTCTDGVKNGEEKGVDCGGSCVNLCTVDTLAPVVLWSKIFNVSGDVYTAVAYVENPNISSKNSRAEYEFRIYDTSNNLINIKQGEVSIPKGRKFAVFETGLVLKGSKPKSADLKFISFGPWEKDTESNPDINLTYGTLVSTSTSPKITGKVTNNSLKTVQEMELAVFVLDGNENVVAASRSFIDNLTPKSTQDFVFTWPKPFDLGVEVCMSPVDLAVALDRSGSMRSESANPPEPFTTVVATAQSFVRNLRNSDQVAVFSFGNVATKESELSVDKNRAISAINNLSLGSTSEQTNISSSLTEALSELISSRVRADSKKVVVLLTDGVPTEPTDINVPNFAVLSAQKVASDVKAKGIEIYTIGLGGNVSDSFLKSISTSDSHFYLAPSKDTLGAVYGKIASNLCVKKPSVINVIYRVLK